jgi:predicted phosphodiesterase
MRVEIQLASDLHLEFLEKNFPHARIIEPVPGADLLVLAGDIHNGIKALEHFGDWPVPVLYLAGNHEFYDLSWDQTRADLRAACAGTPIRFLDNDTVELGGVRFLGCTLWTDFKLPGISQEQAMREVEAGLNDYVLIRTQRGNLRARQTLEDHEHSRRWLERELAKPFDGKTVVITHHGPHPMSIHPRFVGDRLNAGFVSDLTPLLFKVDLWLHGHVHDSVDYRVGGCRVVANPAGYVLNYAVATSGTGFEFENRRFDQRLVLDLPLAVE